MDIANAVLIRIALSLTTFIILTDITAASSESKSAKFLAKLEKKYEDHGLAGIREDLKQIWAEVTGGGQEYSSVEIENLENFLKKLEEDYNMDTMEKARNILEEEWDYYMEIFGKEYTPEEMKMRKTIFEKNKEHIEMHNKLFKQGKVSYSMKLNHFSDRTAEELEKMKGFQPPSAINHTLPKRVARETGLLSYQYERTEVLPNSVDWREAGYVTSVKFQGTCSSCYAFAAIGALEAYHKKKTGYLIDLSVQNILDCTWHLGNKGCNEGFINAVFQYAQSDGVEAEDTYPYTMNASHICEWIKECVVATVQGYLVFWPGDEVAIKHAVANHGPVAAAIGTSNDFLNYHSGVFQTSSCRPISHGVLIVGYGTDPVHGDYWIIKDSIGEFWGGKGFMKIARNRNNMCDIASQASFPI